jgi:CheY-like chemotaxis protein
VYEITPAGASEFTTWIQAAPEAPLSAEKDLVALKLVLATKGDAQGLGWLAETITSVEEEIAQTREFIEGEIREEATPLALLTAEYRLHSYQRRHDFLRDAMRLALGRVVEQPYTETAKRILVVDDSIAARVTNRHVLSAAGYDVRLAEDGAQAWELLQAAQFDALVSDALMPVLDGFALIHRVRTHDATAALPVVMNTVLEEVSERNAALAAGANEFVCKKDANAARLLVDSVDRRTGRSEPAPH